MDIRRLDLRLRADIHEIPYLNARLDEFAVACAIPDEAVFKIELSLDELINNVIDHGYPDRPPGEISVQVAYGGDAVEIIFSDDAELFDPFSIDKPTLDASIEDRPLGGLGVHLVRALMSQTRYFVEGGRNHVHLILGLKEET